MAKLISVIQFTGSIGDFSAYKMRGSDKVFFRTKGGATKERIKKDPAFDMVRRNNVEFAGRAAAAGWINKILYLHKPLADYNYMGSLNAAIKVVQGLDTINDLGKRNILFTRNPQLLEGFSLNRQYLLESIVRNPLACSISRDTLSARVEIPELIPGINLHVQQRYPLYSFVTTLGILPDLYYDPHKYMPSAGFSMNAVQKAETTWYPSINGSEATTLVMQFPFAPNTNDFTLLLAVGIRFGTIESGGTIQQIRHAGAAKIVAVG